MSDQNSVGVSKKPITCAITSTKPDDKVEINLKIKCVFPQSENEHLPQS